jgi:hypothetical protein
MPHIDLKAMLERTVADGYGDLVTRRTGQAVRYGVEQLLAGTGDEQVAIMDFASVRCLDFSCADEIVGKLLLQYGHARYFLLRGLSDGHMEAIEAALERYGLAVVAQSRSGRTRILGPVPIAVRRAFDVLVEAGTAGVREVAGHLDVPEPSARETLAELLHRRLALAAPADDRVRTLT